MAKYRISVDEAARYIRENVMHIKRLNDLETYILPLMEEDNEDWGNEDWCKHALEHIAWLRHSHQEEVDEWHASRIVGSTSEKGKVQ